MSRALRSDVWHAMMPLLALAALTFAGADARAQGNNSPVRIPGPGEGYDITKKEPPGQMASSGYEGRTETSEQTATGNTPATAGKTVIARFTLRNQVKSCPKADGTAEGDGELSFSIQSINKQADGTTTTFFLQGRAVAKYKGLVSDDGFIRDPVKAEIEYTYTVRGTIRDKSGALATAAVDASNVTQSITIDFQVGRLGSMPTLGSFSGGDPTKGRYGEALGAGMALTYWASFWFQIATTRWQQDNYCVQVVFDPPSITVKLLPGAKTMVNAQVKTKTGEVTKARFMGAEATNSAGVSPSEGPSDVGSPMKFLFMAPTKKVAQSGFGVIASSRAGAGSGRWYAGLGTDWSGQITVSVQIEDGGENEMQSWSTSSVSRTTIDVKDGKGTASGFAELHDMKMSRQKALRGGALTLITQQTTTTDGAMQDEDSKATVEVVSPSSGAYVIRVNYAFTKQGTSRTKMCGRDSCREFDGQLQIGAGAPAISGAMDDPNHVRGSKSESKAGGGYRGNGKTTTIVTWDLARKGSGG